MGSEATNALLSDPVQWEEREARRAARDEAPPRCTAPSAPPRNPREVALEWIADRQDRFQAGQELHPADLAYVLVLAIRHQLLLDADFEAALRCELGWRPAEKPRSFKERWRACLLSTSCGSSHA